MPPPIHKQGKDPCRRGAEPRRIEVGIESRAHSGGRAKEVEDHRSTPRSISANHTRCHARNRKWLAHDAVIPCCSATTARERGGSYLSGQIAFKLTDSTSTATPRGSRESARGRASRKGRVGTACQSAR